ncbi:MAG TPA: hypothetical protein VHO69_03535 [Phototrophicaceae bacterium]|nr:hypothetical protein [Phototrophicaceae bacterium]
MMVKSDQQHQAARRQTTEMIERIERACGSTPLGTAQMLNGVELLAACASVGIMPDDLQTVVLSTYPHHAEEIIRVLTWFREVQGTVIAGHLPEGDD